jgi:DHA1 family bicyclomycin/chloramphenicol resistance-like MFS transporter
LVYGTWFTYLSQSTFLFNNIGYSQHTVGYFYIPLAIMIYVGNLLSKFLLAKNYHTEQVFMLGVLSFIAGGMLFIVSLLFFDMKNAVEIILPMSLVSVSNGIVLPIGIASAINIFKEKSGVVSGLVGFVQIGFSALCASFIGELFGISFVTLAITVFLMSVTALVSHLVLRKYSLYVASANM